MTYVYVALTIVGVVMLCASLLGGEHDHAAGHGGGADHPSPAFALLSVRVWTYLFAFGGLTGLLLRLVANVGEPWSAIVAAGVGVTTAAMARALLERASRAGPSGTVQAQDLVGRTGAVVVPFGAGATGKIRVRVAGGDLDVLATADGEELGQHDEVLIVELREGGTALVTRSPSSR